MKGFKYELHCHTAEGSGCSTLGAIDAVRYYMGLGYSGLCITDHFTGKTTVPNGTPWAERVEMFCEGYEKAAAFAVQHGFKVFFGLEYSDGGNDFLFFNIDKAWLLSNPDLLSLSLPDILDRVRNGGGYVVHAHPFAEAKWIPSIKLLPRKVDAVEVVNGGCDDETNGRAAWYAKSYGLTCVAGTDTHTDGLPHTCGVVLKKEVATVAELVEELRAKRVKVFKKSTGLTVDG